MFIEDLLKLYADSHSVIVPVLSYEDLDSHNPLASVVNQDVRLDTEAGRKKINGFLSIKENMKTENYKITKNPYGGWDVRSIHEEGVIKKFDDIQAAEDFLRDMQGESIMPEKVTIDMKKNEVDRVQRSD